MNDQTLLIVVSIIVAVLTARYAWLKVRDYETLKSEFITIIAHKFRTPLTQMKWLIEEILEKEKDPYKTEGLKNLEKSNQNLIDLTGTLIELTESGDKSLASYSFEKTDVCTMMREMMESLKDDFHEKNIFISFKCSVPEIFAKLDKQRMEFVFHTLLENSMHYSYVGKNVDVSISLHGRKIIIEVTDYGIGIDKSEMPRLFTKFFRSQSAQSMDTDGFGVGLYLAQSIMKRHKGKIEAFSEGINTGSTFRITLPSVK